LAVTGITESMIQYGKATEVIFNNKPKYSRPHGIKRPDSRNIIAVLAGIFFVLVVIAMYM